MCGNTGVDMRPNSSGASFDDFFIMCHMTPSPVRMTHACFTLCAPYSARVETHGIPYFETRGGDPYDALS